MLLFDRTIYYLLKEKNFFFDFNSEYNAEWEVIERKKINICGVLFWRTKQNSMIRTNIWFYFWRPNIYCCMRLSLSSGVLQRIQPSAWPIHECTERRWAVFFFFLFLSSGFCGFDINHWSMPEWSIYLLCYNVLINTSQREEEEERKNEQHFKGKKKNE